LAFSPLEGGDGDGRERWRWQEKMGIAGGEGDGRERGMAGRENHRIIKVGKDL